MRDTRKLKLGDIPLVFYLFPKVSDIEQPAQLLETLRERHRLVDYGYFLIKKGNNVSYLTQDLH